MVQDRLPRSEWEPSYAAADVIGRISIIYYELNPGKTSSEFLTELLEPLYSDPLPDGDALIGSRACDASGVDICSESMKISLSYCIQATNAELEGRIPEAWSFVCDALLWMGIAYTQVTIIMSPSDASPLRENAKKAAAARHKENREIAEQIMEWFRNNHSKYSSLDSAAEAAQDEAPVSFRTARKHVGAAAKKYSLHVGRKRITQT